MSTPRRKGGSWRYSGDGNSSRQFWGRVGKLKGKDSAYLYKLGCCLQDLEERVLRALVKAEYHAKLKREGS